MASQQNRSSNDEISVSSSHHGTSDQRERMVIQAAQSCVSPAYSNGDTSSSNTALKPSEQNIGCHNEGLVASHFVSNDISLKKQPIPAHESTNKKIEGGLFKNLICISDQITCKNGYAASSYASNKNAECPGYSAEIQKSTEDDFRYQSIASGSSKLDSASNGICDPSLITRTSNLEVDKKNKSILIDMQLTDVPSCSGGRSQLEGISFVEFWDDWKQLFDNQESVKHETTEMTDTDLIKGGVKDIHFKAPPYEYLIAMDPNILGVLDINPPSNIENSHEEHAPGSAETPQHLPEHSCFSRFVKDMVSAESVPHQNDASASQNNPIANECSNDFLSDLEILSQLQCENSQLCNGISTMESSSKGKQPMSETCVNSRHSGIQFSCDLLNNKQTKKSVSGQAWIQRWHSRANILQSNVRSNLYVMSERPQQKARNSSETYQENLPSVKAIALAGNGVEKIQTSRSMGLISAWSYNSMKLFKSKELAEGLVI